MEALCEIQRRGGQVEHDPVNPVLEDLRATIHVASTLPHATNASAPDTSGPP